MSKTFANVAMFLAPGERANPAAMYRRRKEAYAALQRYATENGRMLIGEPIERPTDYGIQLTSETRAAE